MPHIFSHKGEKIYTHHSIDSYPDSNVFNMHAHDWLEILYFISGKGQYVIKDTVYPMDAGDIFVIRPGEMHKLQIDSSLPYERIVIRFSPALLDGWASKDDLLKVFYDRPEGSKNRFKSEVSTKVKTAFRDYSFDEINNIELNLFG
ncbi:MAG: AraC family ligand binding domain-containing protein, partial [Firmicutes bacterium]|nr:AraC family ligand binding domain-containing protein [Bacillota bacterium]